MDETNILIVGAGVAGLTCAGLLQGHDLNPLIVEREDEASFNTSGYMLGLLPLGGRVLSQLNLREAYFDLGIEMKAYNINASSGKTIRSYPLDFINEEYGSYRGISRIDLVKLLRDSGEDKRIEFGRTVRRTSQAGDAVEVEFSDGGLASFDVVIVADGLHSETRKLVLQPSQYDYKDTGWGGWVTWLADTPDPQYDEYWGAGTFLGLYPVRDRTGVFLGGPADAIQRKGLEAFASEVARPLSHDAARPRRALQAFEDDDRPFFWRFEDCRTTTWRRGNVVLLGDAATGFLPTAGVGASMAMDSASALADELSRGEPGHLDYALRLYERRQRDRVERAQADSRRFGRMMFVKNPLAAAARNWLVSMYSLQRMLKDLGRVMEGE